MQSVHCVCCPWKDIRFCQFQETSALCWKFLQRLSVHVFHLHLRLKKLAKVLPFLKTASFPFPLFQSAAALFLSHMEIEPGWRQAEEWGGRDGRMGSRSWKIKTIETKCSELLAGTAARKWAWGETSVYKLPLNDMICDVSKTNSRTAITHQQRLSDYAGI